MKLEFKQGCLETLKSLVCNLFKKSAMKKVVLQLQVVCLDPRKIANPRKRKSLTSKFSVLVKTYVHTRPIRDAEEDDQK